LPVGPTSARSRRGAVPARERAQRPAATASGDPPSTLWVAQRSARPDRFTGMIGFGARHARKSGHAPERIGFALPSANPALPFRSTESGTEPRSCP
jgi:hypothetical protein